MNIQSYLPKNNPAFWVVVVSLLLGLGQLQRVQLTPTTALYMHDLVILTGVLLSRKKLSVLPQQLRQNKAVSIWIWVIGLFVVLGLARGAALQREMIQPLLYVARLGTYGLFGWSLHAYLHQHRQRAKSYFSEHTVPVLLLSVLGIGLLTWWFGVLQYIFFPDTRFLYLLGWDDHLHRLISTQLDPGYAGALLVASFILLQHPGFDWMKQWRFIISLSLVGGLGLTYSRSSFLMFAVGVGLLWVVQKTNWKQWLVYGVLFVLLVVGLPSKPGEGTKLLRSSTLTARQQQAFQQLDDLTISNIVIGNGIFTQTQNSRGLAEADHANVPDNWILFLLSGLGGVGSVLALSWILILLAKMYHQVPIWFVQTVSLLAFGLFNNVLQPFVVLTWLLSGVVLLLTHDT